MNMIEHNHISKQIIPIIIEVFESLNYNITFLGVKFILRRMESPGYEIDRFCQPPMRKPTPVNFKFILIQKKDLLRAGTEACPTHKRVFSNLTQEMNLSKVSVH